MALKYVPQFKTTTLNVGGGIDASQTTGIILQSVTGVDITKPGVICISWADPLDTDVAEWITFTSIDGSNELQGVVRGAEGSTGRVHANNVSVAFPVSKAHINDLNDAMLAQHDNTGNHTGIKAPLGFLVNGLISASVASNNLTVAIKGLNGSDPSSTNPVAVRIGDSIRTITSALSVTKNAGTNWFDAGGTALATKEIDYFVYLGYNATDGVVIGFARVPYGTRYDSFSATTTNEEYCAISTITTASASDAYSLVGRFAATLSAGAGYTWTVPTFTAVNLVQRPVFETRWLDYTPTYTPDGTMTYGTVTTDYARYKISADRLQVNVRATGTIGGTPSTFITVTSPFSAGNSSYWLGSARSDSNGAEVGFLSDSGSASSFRVNRYNGSNWTAGASRYVIANALVEI